MHIKEIIWTTIILFVSSIFIIGYGTSRAISQQKEREKMARDAEKRAAAQKNAVPLNLRDKLNLPVAHISYPTENASLTTVIDVKSLWHSVKGTPEYQQVSAMPEGIKEFYGGMIKERALETLITMSLVDLYAQAKKIKPQVTAQALVESARQQITPVEFERELRRQGLTTDEFGQERLKQVTMQAVAQQIMRPIPPASATEDVLRNYYQKNKIWFKMDDQISFNHLLVSPDDFAGETEITDEQIKEYFDNHRNDFLSSKRVEVTHIFVNPNLPEYLNAIEVSDHDIRRKYSENLDRFKDPEKVSARHILIKPKDSFESKFNSFSANFRNFDLEETDEGTLISFDIGLSEVTAATDFGFDNFLVKTSDGQEYYPTTTSQESVENPLPLPVSGSTKSAIQGRVAILADPESTPSELIVKDGSVSNTFDISSAFESEKAFAAAEKEIKEILAQIKSGKDFAEMAKAKSQDTGSASKGGDLGEFSRGQMVKPFEEVAFASNVGQISDPVRSQFGYHIIRVEKKIPEKVRSLDQVRPELIAESRKQRADMKALSTLEGVRQKIIYQSETVENLVKRHSMAKSIKNQGKLPVFFRGEITDDYSEEQKKILIEEISEDGSSIAEPIEVAVFAMEPGQVSEVIKTSKGYHVFYLNRVLEPIQLSLTKTLKNQIHQILEKQAQEELAKAAAEKLRTDYPNANVEFLARTYQGEDKEIKVNFSELPFSPNPGFSSFALSDATGQFSTDGRTYVKEVHNNLMILTKDQNYSGKIAGPFKSSLGYHFLEVTEYKGDRYEAFEDVKEKIKRMLTLEPTQEEIRKEFEANKDKLDRPATRRLRQIIVSEEKVANEIYERLKKGEIFALLAKKYSIDSGTAQNGGLTPPVKKGQLSKDLDEKVWNLKKGEFTQPVKTPYGYVIAYLESDEIPGSEATMTPEVISGIKRKLRQDIQNEVWMAFIKGLNHQAYVIRHPKAISEI
jgi:parvulin-like peptidyl-prolyl isomerase